MIADEEKPGASHLNTKVIFSSLIPWASLLRRVAFLHAPLSHAKPRVGARSARQAQDRKTRRDAPDQPWLWASLLRCTELGEHDGGVGRDSNAAVRWQLRGERFGILRCNAMVSRRGCRWKVGERGRARDCAAPGAKGHLQRVVVESRGHCRQERSASSSGQVGCGGVWRVWRACGLRKQGRIRRRDPERVTLTRVCQRRATGLLSAPRLGKLIMTCFPSAMGSGPLERPTFRCLSCSSPVTSH